MAAALVPGSLFTANFGATAAGAVFDWSTAFTSTSGNALLFVYVYGSTTATVNVPSGWTLVHDNSGSTRQFGAIAFYKENCGAETSVTVTASGTLAGIASIVEVSGGKVSGLVDVNGKAEDESANDASTTAVSTGTTGTRSQANGLGLAAIFVDNGNGVSTDTWASGWVDIAYANRTTNGGFRLGQLAVSSTAGQTATYTIPGDQAYGLIVIFDEASGGGPSPVTIDTPGALTITGQTLTVNTNVALTNGSLSIVGQAVAVNLGTLVTAGALTIAGQTLTTNTNVAVIGGALTLAGQTLDTNLPAGPGDLGLDIDVAGSLTIVGQSVASHVSTAMTAGALAVAGHTATVQVNVPLTQGALTISGQTLTPTLTAHRWLDIEGGSLVITGQTIGLDLPGGPVISNDFRYRDWRRLTLKTRRYTRG
jgi:hypothetical protein